jgi:transcriptional regulator with XRE-family HTH domain
MGQNRDEILIEKIVDRIRELRNENGVTLEVFFNDTGIHLARIESQRRNVTVSTLKRICSYFEVNLSEFFSGLDE